MDEERDAVRALRVAERGMLRQHRLDDLDVAEHGGGEEIERRAVLEQEERDLAVAHVRRRPEAGLEVAAAPVPRRLHERGLLREQSLHRVEVAVRHRHELVDERRVELRRTLCRLTPPPRGRRREPRPSPRG